MATNITYDPADHLSVVVTHPTAPVSGDPVRYGAMTGIALTDEGAGGNEATNTSVHFGMYAARHVVDDDGGSGIAVGAAIYYHDTPTGSPASNLNNVASGMNAFYGIALETVGAGATTEILVLHVPLGATTTFAAGGVATANLADDAVTTDKIDETVINFADVTLTAAQVKALKATPITLVAAPGADLAVVPIAVNLVANYGGTNAFTESGDDLSIGYAAGAELKEIESTGLIDQTNDEWRYITFEFDETFIPTPNVAVVITNLDDEIAGNAANNNTVAIRLFFRVVPTNA